MFAFILWTFVVSGFVLATNPSFECPGYRVSNGLIPIGRSIKLSLLGDDKLSDICKSFGKDYPELEALIEYETDTRIRVRIQDVQHQRWVVPNTIVPRPGHHFDSGDSERLYSTSITQEPFGFAINRKMPCKDQPSKLCDGPVIFNTTDGGLIFKEQYIELSTELPLEAHIYGLGETVSSFRRDNKYSRTTLWARDAPTPPEENVYGTHPFYIEIRDGKAHGVFFVSSVGMDVIMNPGKLTYKALGGIFEFYFFLGPTPQDVLRQYTDVVGKPAMMPSWSFGWHQCRWGYNTIEDVETVVNAYNRSHIPLEAMWIDIDYMDGYRDFSYDPRRFAVAKMKAFRGMLDRVNQKLVLIVDPGIKIDRGYPAYDSGISSGIFMSNPRTEGKPFIGKVWPGYTHFPDWFHPSTQDWWNKQFIEWFKLVDVDGIWIDMNEIANFCESGDCFTPTPDSRVPIPSVNWSKFQGIGAFHKDFNPFWPKYRIDNGGRNQELPLHHRTSPMDALHHDDILEYFVHNLYGHMEGVKTYNMLKTLKPNERPFILSRSTFSGSGKYMAHWLGDNWSTWESMRHSLSGILSFTSVFGIPMVGSDICGFIGNTDEELCRRWTQLGAVIYPFARNHNYDQGRSQEPYLWPSVAEASRKYIGMRYELLPYWYTLFWRAHEFGETHVVRPLAWEFSDSDSPQSSAFDASQVLFIDREVLIGPAILVNPILEPGVTSVRGFIPKGTWFEWESGKVDFNNPSSGIWHDLDAPADRIPIHLRAGYIIPMHDSPQYHNTKDIWNDARFALVVGLNPVMINYGEPIIVSQGEMFLDNEAGLFLHNEITNVNAHIKFSVSIEPAGNKRYKSPDGRWIQIPVYNIWIEANVERFNHDEKDCSKHATLDRIKLYGLPLLLSKFEASPDLLMQRDDTNDNVSIGENNVNFTILEVGGLKKPHDLSYQIQNYGVVEMRWSANEGMSLNDNWKLFMAVGGKPKYSI